MDPRDIANEQSKPGKFNLIERLQGRNMPADKVVIYLDEGAAFERSKLIEEQLHASPEETAELDERIAELEATIRASAVTIHMRGISSKRYDQLLEEALVAHPIEYEEITNPITGQKQKQEIPSEERDDFFNMLYTAECIESAEMGGDVDEDITPEWLYQFRDLAPLDAVRLVVGRAFSMRMASEWMDQIQNEDFSLRP